jgi:hypothetical protein
MGPYVPQLLFPMFAAIRRAAEPTVIEWRDAESVDELPSSDIPAWVAARVDPVLTAANPGSTIVIGKSLGTHAAVAAARLSLPAIWVTPLLRDMFVLEALTRSTAPFLLVGGSADPLWDGSAARALTPHVVELPGADHGLFVPGPLNISARNIGDLATASERFLDENVWPSTDKTNAPTVR